MYIQLSHNGKILGLEIDATDGVEILSAYDTQTEEEVHLTEQDLIELLPYIQSIIFRIEQEKEAEYRAYIKRANREDPF